MDQNTQNLKVAYIYVQKDYRHVVVVTLNGSPPDDLVLFGSGTAGGVRIAITGGERFTKVYAACDFLRDSGWEVYPSGGFTLRDITLDSGAWLCRTAGWTPRLIMKYMPKPDNNWRGYKPTPHTLKRAPVYYAKARVLWLSQQPEVAKALSSNLKRRKNPDEPK